MKKSSSRILLIGTNTPLAYLIRRYVEQGGYELAIAPTAPTVAEVLALRPVAILFPSVEDLGAAQGLIVNLTDHVSTVLVCLSTADEARARELGADYCLSHPLTYANFLNALVLAQARSAKL